MKILSLSINNILRNKNTRLSYAFLLIIVLTIIYVFISKESVKDRFLDRLTKELLLNYKTYKKIYKISPNIKSVLIENDDYIDKSEMIDELTKSTPFLMEKKKNR